MGLLIGRLVGVEEDYAPPAQEYLLLETGDFVLLETNDKIELEDATP